MNDEETAESIHEEMAYREIILLFTPTRIRVQPDAALHFGEFEIGAALWRHVQGDWGDWSQEAESAWQAGEALDCYYVTETGYFLRLRTSADRCTTSIVVRDPYEEDD